MAARCIRCKSDINLEYKACPKCGEPVTDFLRRYLAQPIDGKYEIVDRLGVGGMGEVYKVRHTFLGATRVVKVIRPQISEHEDTHERFLREARVATRIQHPNVATLHDFSALPDGSHYMVWEFIEGENLAQQMKGRGPLPPRQAVRIAIEALHGLEAIHRAGIVHRDISPENLMITKNDRGGERVKVIDLGVAKSEDPGADSVTRTGVFVGKFRYASPEHLGFLPEGERIDGRADLYSLGIVLYEMLAGRPPFEATTPHQYVLMHSKETAFKPLDLPAHLAGPELQNVLRRALERDRGKRFASAAEFAQALQQVERVLPDQSSVKTMAGPMPEYAAESTLRTPVPAATPPTVRTPIAPQSTTVIAGEGAGAPLRRVWIPVLALLIGVAIAAAFLIPRRRENARGGQAPPPVQLSDAATTAPQAAVDVIPPSPIEIAAATNPDTAPPSPLLTSPPVRPRRIEQTRPVLTPAPAPQPQPQPERVVERPQPAVAAYIDGRGGDDVTNDRLLEGLRQQLRGIKRIGVSGGDHLLRSLQNEIESVSFVRETAVVNIDFEGRVTPLGRGRKRREGQATITKDGRVIFRYQMPAQEYRVGDTPAEAFTNVMASALDQ